MRRGKRYREAYEKVDRTRAYPPVEAIRLIKEAAGAKFDETVEVHVRLGVNVRHAEEQLRGTLALPKGLGKEVTIAVFAEGDVARQATDAGADFVGSDDLAERIEGGWTDFDVAIAHPSQMPKVGKLGRILGPQGKMPNPKVGTVTEDIAKAVDEAKAGKVEYRTDRQAIVHLAIGKTSFSDEDLLENYAAVIDGTRGPGRPRPYSPRRDHAGRRCSEPRRRRRGGRRGPRVRRTDRGGGDRLDFAETSHPRPSAGPTEGPEVRRR
jgi:large subunit ribosomal protein L1